MKTKLSLGIVGLLLSFSSFANANPLGLTAVSTQKFVAKGVTSPYIGTTRLSFNQRVQKKSARKLNLGRLSQPLGACPYTGSNPVQCGMGSFFGFMLITVPILSAVTLTALIGDIVTLSIKKSRFAMGVSSVVLSSVGILVGVLTSAFIGGGDFGILMTLVSQVPMLALGAATIYMGRHDTVIKRASLTPWFNMSRDGAVTGGVAMGGVF